MKDQGNTVGHLVHKFSGMHSTEELIFFVAGTDNMLSLCKLIVEQHDRDGTSPLLREVDRCCAERGVLPGTLFAELRKVLLALNRFHNTGRDHYATLGLTPEATLEDVKKSYRALSKKYHPDTRPEPGDGSRQFMEIAGAYHAIMAATTEKDRKEDVPWRQPRRRKTGGRLRDRKMFFLGIAVLLFLLAGTSMYLSGRHSRMVLVDRLQSGTADAADAEGAIRDTPASPSSAAHEPGPAAGENPPVLSNPPPADVPAGTDMMPEETPRITGTGPTADQETGLDRQESPSRDTVAVLPAIMQPPQPQTGKTEKSAPASDNEDAAASTQLPVQTSRQKSIRIDRINTTLEINSLISRYCSLYSRRELDPFLNLFADQALENGKPLNSLINKYRILFAHTRDIDLQVDEINWQQEPSGYRAGGSFHAAYDYRNGEHTAHRGRITFSMIREQGYLKIKSLDYTFE